MLIFISAGEPSGDLHGSNLVRALRKVIPDAEFVGFGGPRMARAGVALQFQLTNLAIMWFLQVFQNIITFLKLLKQAERYFAEKKPAAVVLIDYPGFHWLLAKRAKKHGIPVYYYVPPQIWAWAGWRINKVKKYVDKVFCSLPFEPKWYAERGYTEAEYTGHPFFDELGGRELDSDFLAEQQSHVGQVVLLLPGSRTLELKRNLPAMLRAAAEVASKQPDVRFDVACHHDGHAELAREIAQQCFDESDRNPSAKRCIPPARLHIYAGRTPELMRLADMAWAVSGSVGLELLHEALPTVVLYKVRKVDLWIARPFIKSKYISLVNLLADEEVMPEYLTDRDVSPELAAWGLRWLTSATERGQASRRLAALRDRVAQPGASERAAASIAEALGVRSQPTIYRGPHLAVSLRRRGQRRDEGPGDWAKS
jgi:lipid-A-disaccharide synthase